jgi:hypothetical protein
MELHLGGHLAFYGPGRRSRPPSRSRTSAAPRGPPRARRAGGGDRDRRGERRGRCAHRGARSRHRPGRPLPADQRRIRGRSLDAPSARGPLTAAPARPTAHVVRFPGASDTSGVHTRARCTCRSNPIRDAPSIRASNSSFSAVEDEMAALLGMPRCERAPEAASSRIHRPPPV